MTIGGPGEQLGAIVASRTLNEREATGQPLGVELATSFELVGSSTVGGSPRLVGPARDVDTTFVWVARRARDQTAS